MAVRAIPEGYHSVTPYMIIKGAAGALEYYKKAFNATELMRIDGPNGTIGHAEIRIGDSILMMADEFPQMGCLSPLTAGSVSVSLMIYVPNVDEIFAQAIKAGGTEKRAIQNQFYGDRSGTLVDPFGHMWTVSTHIEDVPPDELARRAAASAPH